MLRGIGRKYSGGMTEPAPANPRGGVVLGRESVLLCTVHGLLDIWCRFL